LIEVWKEINEYAQKENIEIVGLKGIHLLDDVYANFGERKLEDIDLLVDDDVDCENLVDFLQSIGFTKVEEQKWWANNYKIVLTGNWNEFRVVVEVHKQLLMGKQRQSFWETNSHNSKTFLSQESQLVYLIGHMANQHTFLHLNWLLDIYLIINKYPDLDWPKVVDLINKIEIRNGAYSTFYVLRKYLNVEFPQIICDFEATFKQNKISRLHRILDNKLLWYDQRSTQYYKLKYYLKDNLKESTRYTLGWSYNQISRLFCK